jgi:molybdate transport system substrate-binding protein
VVGIFPEDSHSPIIYPEALVTAGTNPNASNFLSFLSSPEDGEIFELQGFTVLP